MALFRKSKSPTGRRRLQSDGASTRTAFSYTRTGSQSIRSETDRPKKHTPSARSFWLQRFGAIILTVVIAVCLINVLSLSPHAKLLPVDSNQSRSNTFLRDQSVYQAAADKLLAGSLWNSNKVTINTGDFSRQMIRQFPELSGASVALPLLGHRPVVYIQAAQPSLVLAADNGSFVIDNRGRALMPADNSQAQNKLPQVVDQSGLQVKLGQPVLSAANVRFIQTIVAQLAARHITASSLVLPAGTSEVDVHIAGQTYFVKFNLHEDDPRQQAGTYLATIADLQRKHVTPAKYIDVRVPGRAYYQ